MLYIIIENNARCPAPFSASLALHKKEFKRIIHRAVCLGAADNFILQGVYIKMINKKLGAIILTIVLSAGTLLTGCSSSIDSDAVVATYGDEEITLGFANFMARYQQSQYDSYYLSYYGDDMWSTEVTSSGYTMEDQVKEEVMQNIHDLYAIADGMQEYEVELTEDDETAIKDAAAEFMENNSDEAIEQLGATTEYVEQMLRLYTQQQKVQDAIYATVDTDVSDKEAAQRTFSYVAINKTSYTDDDGNTVDYTDEEAAALADTAADFRKAALKDFDKAAEDSGYDVLTQSYGSAEDDVDEVALDNAVLKAADKLSKGEISDVVETDDYYYIIRLDSEYDEDATQEKKDSIISERQSDAYDEKLEEYETATEWELNDDVWAQVKFDTLFTNVDESEDESEEADTTTESETTSTDEADTATESETTSDDAE